MHRLEGNWKQTDTETNGFLPQLEKKKQAHLLGDYKETTSLLA